MSPITPDPYVILGVAKDAQIGEIRSAHRKLVLKCHPDKVQDPELKAQKQDEFQKVQQAYEILSDEKERKRYDDTVQLAELRRQMQNKANISVSRSSPKYQEFEIRTAEPSSFKSTSSHIPPNVKIHTASYPPRSYDEERRSGSRYYDGVEPARSSRREATYSDRSSKREFEKEREREREKDKDKERERERRRRKEKEREREEELRRQEKEEKKAREKDKKRSDKLRSKDLKRETENKRRETDSPYIETYEEEYAPPKPEKKKSSSSRKHDEKRERSSHRDDPTSMPRFSPEEPPTKLEHARAYIQQSQRSGPERSHSYHLRSMPAVPTPPPADNATFAPPEEEIRRSSARPRSGETPPTMLREKSSYQRPSRERLDRDRDEPIIVSASPTSRHPFPSKMAHPEMSSSPPHITPVHRTNTMPMPTSTPSTARPIPMVGRSNTFSGGFDAGDSPANKGRHRSRKYPQVDEEEFEDDYERRHVEKERKHRSSKKHSTPERPTETRYHVDNGRAKLYHSSSSSSYSRKIHAEPETFYYDMEQPRSGASRVPESHSTQDAYGGANYRVKQSRAYGASDIQYSTYPAAQTYRDGYSEVYAA